MLHLESHADLNRCLSSILALLFLIPHTCCSTTTIQTTKQHREIMHISSQHLSKQLKAITLSVYIYIYISRSTYQSNRKTKPHIYDMCDKGLQQPTLISPLVPSNLAQFSKFSNPDMNAANLRF